MYEMTQHEKLYKSPEHMHAGSDGKCMEEIAHIHQGPAAECPSPARAMSLMSPVQILHFA